MQAAAYALVCWNFRAMAKGFILQTVGSDLLIAALGYTLFEQIVEATKSKDKVIKTGYILGGAAGSVVSILLTKHFLGL